MAAPEDTQLVSGKPVDGEETRFRDLLDRLSETVFEFDLQGRFVYVNRTGFEIFGYTREELVRGLTAFEMVIPEERELLRANLASRFAGTKSEGHEYTALRKDGSTFPALVHTSVLYRDGKPYGMQGYLVDISERVQSENALRRRIDLEQLIMRISAGLVREFGLRALDSHIDEALADLGRFLRVDRSYLFLVSDDGEFIDNTHEWVADGVSEERANLQRIPLRSFFPWFLDELRRNRVVLVPDVSQLPPEALAERREFEREGIRSLLCVALPQGDEVRGFLGLDAVRSSRNWSPDEIAILRVAGEILMGALLRQRAEKALRESEKKYRAIVEDTFTGFVIIDSQGRVLDANAEYVRMTGRASLAEIRGRSVTEWTAVHDRERNAQAVAACSEHGHVRDLQVDYVHDDGTTIPVLIHATAVDSGAGRHITSLVRDISDRKRLEEELLRSEKLRSVGILAGGIAHDFNNILTAVMGNISLLQATLQAEDGAQEALAEAKKASLRARELTQQLLTFSRGGEPVRRPFRADVVVQESATMALRGRATACEFRIAEACPLVDGDEGQVAQVIRNLVLNASQAMEGAGVVTISVEERKVRSGEVHGLAPGRYVVTSVADRGEGVPEEHRSRIFDPYFTTKHDGRGLGLAVSHSIVTRHKGAITLSSHLGQGSTFTVYLPAAEGDRDLLTPPPTETPFGRGRVLVMDDEENVCSTATKMLSLLGYESTCVRDGRQAIESWQRARAEGRPYDLVIMDLTVPGGMGGREAMAELLALDPAVRGIVSSGYSQGPVLANHADHGFREVLAKPYSVEEMGRALQTAMNKS